MELLTNLRVQKIGASVLGMKNVIFFLIVGNDLIWKERE